jgi:anti-anti-sigma factor
MDLDESKVGGVTVVAVKGRLDTGGAPLLGTRLAAVLDDADAPRVLLDLAGLDYVSSAGLRVLLVAAKRADERGGKLALAGLSPKVRQLFELGGFLDLFPIYAARDDALAALA